MDERKYRITIEYRPVATHEAVGSFNAGPSQLVDRPWLGLTEVITTGLFPRTGTCRGETWEEVMNLCVAGIKTHIETVNKERSGISDGRGYDEA